MNHLRYATILVVAASLAMPSAVALPTEFFESAIAAATGGCNGTIDYNCTIKTCENVRQADGTYKQVCTSEGCTVWVSGCVVG